MNTRITPLYSQITHIARQPFTRAALALLVATMLACTMLSGCAQKNRDAASPNQANGQSLQDSSARSDAKNDEGAAQPFSVTKTFPQLTTKTWEPIVKLAHTEYFMGVDGQYNIYTLNNYKEVKRYSPAGKLTKTIKLDASARDFSLEYGAVTSNGTVAVVGESIGENASFGSTVFANGDNPDKLTVFAPTKGKNAYSLVADGTTLLWDEIDAADVPTTYALDLANNSAQPLANSSAQPLADSSAQPTVVRTCPDSEKEQPLHLDSLVTSGVLSFIDGQTSILYQMKDRKTLASSHLYATNEMVYFNGLTQGYVSPEGLGNGDWLASKGLVLPSGKKRAKSILDERFTLKVTQGAFEVRAGGIANVRLSTYQQNPQELAVFGQAFNASKNYSYVVARLAH